MEEEEEVDDDDDALVDIVLTILEELGVVDDEKVVLVEDVRYLNEKRKLEKNQASHGTLGSLALISLLASEYDIIK